MKFTIQDPELRYRYKLEKRKSWHKWFAWHPVRVSFSKVAWLETVERRLRPEDWAAIEWWRWEYRAYT
jgi:hypothetical protein